MNNEFKNFGIPDEILEKAKRNEKFCENWDERGHTVEGCKLEFEGKETKCRFYVCQLCKFIIRILPIKNYEGYYEVSDNGRIFSVDRYINKWNGFNYAEIFFEGIEMKQHENDRGYLGIKLSCNGKNKSFRVNRLVAKAFVSNPNNHSEVNHIDGIKLNNNWWNLEWTNRSGNIQHSFDIGLQISLKGEETAAAILTEKKVIEISKLFITGLYTQKEIAEMYNVAPSTISAIINRRTWMHLSLDDKMRAMPRGISRGEKSGAAKLTNQKVLKMREMAKSGKYTQRELSKMFLINEHTVWCIINRKSWKHI